MAVRMSRNLLVKLFLGFLVAISVGCNSSEHRLAVGISTLQLASECELQGETIGIIEEEIPAAKRNIRAVSIVYSFADRFGIQCVVSDQFGYDEIELKTPDAIVAYALDQFGGKGISIANSEYKGSILVTPNGNSIRNVEAQPSKQPRRSIIGNAEFGMLSGLRTSSSLSLYDLLRHSRTQLIQCVPTPENSMNSSIECKVDLEDSVVRGSMEKGVWKAIVDMKSGNFLTQEMSYADGSIGRIDVVLDDSGEKAISCEFRILENEKLLYRRTYRQLRHNAVHGHKFEECFFRFYGLPEPPRRGGKGLDRRWYWFFLVFAIAAALIYSWRRLRAN
jgi:hypothetical protein